MKLPSAASGGRAALPADRLLFRELYYRNTPRAVRYRYGLLILDAVTLLFIICTSFIDRTTFVEVADTVLGTILLAEFVARLRASPRPWWELFQPVTLADAVAILCFLLYPGPFRQLLHRASCTVRSVSALQQTK